MNIIEIKTPDAIEKSYRVLKELRDSLTFQNFIYLYEAAKEKSDFKMVGVFEGGQCVAVMGYRILFDFIHEKHLYVDDLVVTVEKRSTGIGADLLKFAEQKARELQCKGLRLCTGIQMKDAQRFYEKHGWQAKAIAYKKVFAAP